MRAFLLRSSFAALLSLLVALGLARPAMAADRVVHGHVQARSGAPIDQVFVRQEGGLTSTFTDAHGNFALPVDPQAPDTLLLTAPDRVPARIAFSAADRPVVLALAPMVSPPTTVPPAVSIAPAQADVLDSGFALRGDYRTNDYVAQGANSVSGAVDGELGMNLALREGDWLLEADAMRNRPSVHVPGLSTDGQSTFAPEALEGTLDLGYLFHPAGLDVGPYLVGYGRSASSFANGAQYTGTALDWNDSRWSAGLGGQIAGWIYRPWHLEGLGRIEGYLLTNDRLSGGNVPAQLSALHGAKAEVQLGWEFMPQVRLQVGYQHELWRAFGYAEDADIWTVGLGYYPGSPRQ